MDLSAAEHGLKDSVENKKRVLETFNEGDMDPGCLCASEALLDIIQKKKKDAMSRFEAVLTATEEGEGHSLSKNYAISWIARLLDKNITERLELLEIDLAKDGEDSLCGECEEGIDAETKAIIAYHITEAVEDIRRQVQRITILRHIWRLSCTMNI